MISPDVIPIRNFVENDTTRLISTAYIDEPALSPLVDDQSELAFLEELEGLSSSRRGLPEFIPHGVNPDELLNQHHGYGWSYVNAAFCYTRETGNRFNGSDRGAWYATWGEGQAKTAHSEVAWHLTRELEATGIYENVTAYRELKASFSSNFHDLTEIDDEGLFSVDPNIAYPAGQKLASTLIANGAQGILYPSIRRAGGLCLAAFRPNIIQNIRQGDTWTFEWSGSPEPKISKS